MKNIMILLALVAAFNTGCQKDDDDNNKNSIVPITAQEALDLAFLIEEEKLARDVYLFSASIYSLTIYPNIANSEQSHMDRVETLLNRYDIENPILGMSEGEFVNPDLQELYDVLTASAQTSPMNALIVGATIEDLDIADIETLVVNTNKADLLDAYSDLTCGSRNHLRSYISQIITDGGNYTPQYISEDLFTDIVESAVEQCGR